jgi:hypothetical protein
LGVLRRPLALDFHLEGGTLGGVDADGLLAGFERDLATRFQRVGDTAQVVADFGSAPDALGREQQFFGYDTD